MIRKLIDWCLSRKRDPLPMLDHLPVRPSWFGQTDAERLEKLWTARQRHGRAFRCAGLHFDREVIIVPGEVRVLQGYAAPTKGMIDRGNVRTIRRAAT